MAAGVVVCPLVGITLIVIGIVRASSGEGNAGPVLGFTLIFGPLLIAGAFICLHRLRTLGHE